MGPDGNVILAGSGITIADVSTTGETASTLTINNIADTQGGNYICRATVIEDVLAPITVQGTAIVATCICCLSAVQGTASCASPYLMIPTSGA